MNFVAKVLTAFVVTVVLAGTIVGILYWQKIIFVARDCNVPEFGFTSGLTSHYHVLNKNKLEPDESFFVYCRNGYSSRRQVTGKCSSGSIVYNVINISDACMQDCVTANFDGVETTIQRWDGQYFYDDRAPRHDDVITFSCDETYYSSGKFEFVCNNGSIGLKEPIKCYQKCQRYPLIYKADSKQYPYKDQVIGQFSINHGDIIRYHCVDGYYTNGSLTFTCNDGFIDTRGAECVKDCGLIPKMKGGKANKSFLKHGEEIIYTCKEGYSYHGPPLVFYCYYGGVNLRHRHCQKDCVLPSINNTIPVNSSIFEHSYYTYVRCNKDYQPVGAPQAQRQCNNGEWEPNFDNDPYTCVKSPTYWTYEEVEGRKTWNNARNHCKITYGGDIINNGWETTEQRIELLKSFNSSRGNDVWLGFEKINGNWMRIDGRNPMKLLGWAEGYPISRSKIYYEMSKYMTISNRPGEKEHGKLRNTFEINGITAYSVICEIPHYD